MTSTRFSPSARRTLAVVLVLSALVKLVYVFGLTNYPSHVLSDTAHYYTRALAYLDGTAPAHVDWDVYPLGSSVLLALYWKALSLFGISASLESALLLNVLASTATVVIAAALALRLTADTLLSLLFAAAYSVFFPLVYLNAFTLSEAPSQLFFMLSVWAMVESQQRERPVLPLLLAGLTWALACQCRGTFLVLAPAYLALLAWRPPAGLARWQALAAFALAAASVFMLASLSLWWASDGAFARTTGSNGGLNFFMQQCHFHITSSFVPGFAWSFNPPVFQDQPELGVFESEVPTLDQGFYYRAGLGCLLHDPGSVAGLAAMLPTLFYGIFYPSFPGAAGLDPAMAVVRHINVALVLLAPAGAWALWRRAPGAIAVLLVSAGLMVLTFVLFNADHRHLYSLTFIYGLLGIVGLATLLNADWRVTTVYAVAAGSIAFCGWWLFHFGGPLSLKVHRPQTVAATRIATPLPDGTPGFTLEALRFWAPLTVQLGSVEHSTHLELSLEASGRYRLDFLRGEHSLGAVELALRPADPPPKGLVRRKLDLPPRIAAEGYDQLRLTPLEGKPPYSVAGLHLTPASAPSGTPTSP